MAGSSPDDAVPTGSVRVVVLGSLAVVIDVRRRRIKQRSELDPVECDGERFFPMPVTSHDLADGQQRQPVHVQRGLVDARRRLGRGLALEPIGDGFEELGFVEQDGELGGIGGGLPGDAGG